MKILKIFEDKLGLDAVEHRQVKTWLVDIENNALTLNNHSTATGGGSGVSTGNVDISFADGISLKNPTSGARSIYLDPDGDAWFGQDTGNPALTSLFIISNSQRYNGEDFGQGDLLIGDNSSDKANVLWDASAGKLYIRSGTTNSVEIGDGGIVVTWGQIGGWTIDADSIDSASDLVVLDSTGKITAGTVEIDGTQQNITIGSNMTLDGAGSTITAGNIVLDGTNDDFSIGTSLVFDGATEKLTVGSGSPNVVIDGTNSLIKSSNFSDEAAGWQIDKDGNAQFNSATIRGRVSSAVFEYEAISAVSGGLAVAKSASQIVEDVVTANPSFIIKVYASQGGSVLFEVADIIRVKYWDGSAIVDFWGIVATVDTTAGITSLACSQITGSVGINLQAGAAVVNYGESSRGLIFLEAGDPTDDTDPKGRMRIATHAGAPYTSMTNALVLGDMYNTYGTGANHRYGIGIGDYSSKNYMSYNAETADEMVFSSADGGITINPTSGITLYDNADDVNFITFRQLTTEERIADLYGDYGGGDQAAAFLRSHRTASSAWDRTYVALAIDDDEFSTDARISLEQVTAGDTYGAALVSNAGLSVARGLNVGSYDNTVDSGDIVLSGAVQIGGKHLQSATDGHLYLNDQSASKYAFIEGAGNVYLSSNMYYNGSAWKTLQAGKSSYMATQGFGGTNAFIVVGDNTSRSAHASTAASILFQVLMDKSGALLPTGGLTGNGMIRSEGSTLATGASGGGLEMAYISTYSRLLSYDRTTASRKPLHLDASVIYNQINGTTVNFADTNGFNMGAGRNYRIHNGTSYVDGGIYVPISPATHSSFNGTAKTTSGPTSYAVSGWGLPSDAIAMHMRLIARDSATHIRTAEYAGFGPTSGSPYQLAVHPIGNDHQAENGGVVNITSGAVWFRCVTSGSNTMDVWSVCYGYWK
jgi:hypothetical protein